MVSLRRSHSFASLGCSRFVFDTILPSGHSPSRHGINSWEFGVDAIACFEQAFLALCKQRPLSRSLTFTEAGLVLGAGTCVAPCGAAAAMRAGSIFPARTAFWRCSRRLSRRRSMPFCSSNCGMRRRFGRGATKASRKSIWNICACQSLKMGNRRSGFSSPIS